MTKITSTGNEWAQTPAGVRPGAWGTLAPTYQGGGGSFVAVADRGRRFISDFTSLTPWRGGAWALTGGLLSNTPPVLNTPIVANPDFDADSDWTKGTGWSITGGEALHSGAAHYLYQTGLLSPNHFYRARFTISSYTSGTVRAYFGTATNANWTTAGDCVNTNQSNSDPTFYIWSNGTARLSSVRLDEIDLAGMCLTTSLLANEADRNVITPPISSLLRGTQAGVVIACDSQTSPQDAIIAYLSGAGEIRVDRIVAGVTTNLLAVTYAYSATKFFSYTLSGRTLKVYYAATPFGLMVASLTLAGDPPTSYTGLFSTDPGNKFNPIAQPFELAPYGAPFQPERVNGVYLIGDSLSADSHYTTELQNLAGADWRVINRGQGGYTTALILNTLNLIAIYPANGYQAYVMAGVNDIINGLDAATVEANLQSIYSALKTAGFKVVALALLPCGQYAGWTAGRQTILDTVNSWIISAPADTDGQINTYAEFESGTTSDYLTATYDSGDHLHLNAAGYTHLANFVYAAFPVT